MGKRGASTPAKGKAAKAARASAGGDADPLASRCAPVVEFLAATDAGGLSSECREMLTVAAPLALKTAKEDRHGYQNQILESISALFAEAERMRRGEVEEAQARVTGLDSKESLATGELEEVLARTSTKQEVKEAKAAAYKAAQDEEAAKDEAVKEAAAKEAALADEQQAVVATKAEFEGLLPQWDQLEEANYHGREWMQRNKTIAVVIKALSTLDLPASLLDALPVAFKLKADARGKFALLTLEHGKAAVKAQIESLGARIDGFASEVEQQAAAVAAAKAALAAAGEATAQAMQASMDAENDWVAEASKANELKDLVKSFAPHKEEAANASEDATAKLETLLGVAVTFRSLVEPPAPPAEEAPAEAAPPAETEEAAAA